MDKGTLLDRMGVTGDDRLLLAKTLDRAERAQKRNIPAATDFLTPRQQALAADCLRQAGIPDTAFLFTGGCAGAERRLALFLPDWMEAETALPPLRFLRAAYRNEDALTHRDLLGSLMGLGIVREKIGDIYVGEDSADVCVLEGIADFLARNWESAGRAKLSVSEIAAADVRIPEANVTEYRDTVSSPRLDALAASAFRMSRGKAAELIAAGRVEVNWRACAKADKLLSPGDTVTARGYGKFVLQDTGGLTRKGRLSVTIRRYW